MAALSCETLVGGLPRGCDMAALLLRGARELPVDPQAGKRAIVIPEVGRAALS